MPENVSTLSDQDLLKKIQESYIQERQKDELKKLLPSMSDEEKGKLMDLIAQADEAAKSDPEYMRRIKELNEEYQRKVNELANKNAREAREEFEKREKEKTGAALEGLEEEMKEAAATPKDTQSANAEKKPKKKTGMIFILILMVLIVIGGGIWYLLQNL